jgi:hypothetical protein
LIYRAEPTIIITTIKRLVVSSMIGAILRTGCEEVRLLWHWEAGEARWSR